MKEPIWIDLADCLAFHEEMLSRFGGLAGIRDERLLDSAMNRPQQLFAYGQPSLFDLATAYASGIIRNHPFLDGNKRAGFMAAALFLEINNHSFIAPEEEVVVQTLTLAAGELTEANYALWLKDSCKRRRKPPQER
jgi:death-on-curing protein